MRGILLGVLVFLLVSAVIVGASNNVFNTNNRPYSLYEFVNELSQLDFGFDNVTKMIDNIEDIWSVTNTKNVRPRTKDVQRATTNGGGVKEDSSWDTDDNSSILDYLKNIYTKISVNIPKWFEDIYNVILTLYEIIVFVINFIFDIFKLVSDILQLAFNFIIGKPVTA